MVSLLRRLVSWRESLGRLLHDRKLAIAGELVVVALIPVLWGLSPVPRTIIPVFLLGWLSLWLRRLGWRDVGLRRPASWRLTILFGVAVGAAVALVGNLVLLPIFLRLTGQAFDPRDVSFLRGNLPALLVVLPGVWVLAALAEEMVYRGYVLNRLTDLFGQAALGWGIGVALSALLFSLAHGVYTPWFVLNGLFIGSLEGVLYLAGRRNLWLPIVFHGTTDTIGIVMLFLGVI